MEACSRITNSDAILPLIPHSDYFFESNPFSVMQLIPGIRQSDSSRCDFDASESTLWNICYLWVFNSDTSDTYHSFNLLNLLLEIPSLQILGFIYLMYLLLQSHSLWFHWCLGMINNDDFDASESYLWWIYCIWFLTVIPQYEAFDAS